MKSERDVWFPSKRYGWGWGPPRKWQGWAVLALFAAAVAAIVIRFPPATNPLEFWILLCLACALLVFVCWWKGEPPRWRWGEREP
jgi:hypothetical protein